MPRSGAGTGFQSHVGSISTARLDYFSPYQPSFNPTLVRLAHGVLLSLIYTAIRFNPTLVRLAPSSASLRVRVVSLFQSHVGSISTFLATYIAKREVGFQSHVGSISTPMFTSSLIATFQFQSHVGSISTLGFWPETAGVLVVILQSTPGPRQEAEDRRQRWPSGGGSVAETGRWARLSGESGWAVSWSGWDEEEGETRAGRGGSDGAENT